MTITIMSRSGSTKPSARAHVETCRGVSSVKTARGGAVESWIYVPNGLITHKCYDDGTGYPPQGPSANVRESWVASESVRAVPEPLETKAVGITTILPLSRHATRNRQRVTEPCFFFSRETPALELGSPCEKPDWKHMFSVLTPDSRL